MHSYNRNYTERLFSQWGGKHAATFLCCVHVTWHVLWRGLPYLYTSHTNSTCVCMIWILAQKCQNAAREKKNISSFLILSIECQSQFSSSSTSFKYDRLYFRDSWFCFLRVYFLTGFGKIVAKSRHLLHIPLDSRPQWPSRLMSRSAAARLLGSLVLIPLGSWCLSLVFLLYRYEPLWQANKSSREAVCVCEHIWSNATIYTYNGIGRII